MTSEPGNESIYLSSGIQAETISIGTGNPRSYHQAITESLEIPPAEIFAKLFIPRGQGPFPVVIVVPGSLGVAPSHINKAEHFTSSGIATCVIDPFGTRGVTSTVANQSQYTFAASAWDVLATTNVLLKRDEIDATRIGAQGHSRGGTAVLSAASIAQYTQADFNLVGIYAAYPWSGHQFLHPKVGQSRIRAVIGERDEWCLPQAIASIGSENFIIGSDYPHPPSTYPNTAAGLENMEGLTREQKENILGRNLMPWMKIP